MSSAPLFTGALLLAALAFIGFLWPTWIGWSFAALAGWFSLNLGVRGWHQREQHRRELGDRTHDD